MARRAQGLLLRWERARTLASRPLAMPRSRAGEESGEAAEADTESRGVSDRDERAAGAAGWSEQGMSRAAEEEIGEAGPPLASLVRKTISAAEKS